MNNDIGVEVLLPPEQLIYKKRSEIILPTGKKHISYSEIADWYECSHRHKLKHIDKLGVDPDSIHTIYGQVLHDALEELINHRNGQIDVLTEADKWIEKFNFMLDEHLKNPDLPIKNIEDIHDNRKAFANTIARIISEALPFMDNQFPGWRPVGAEIEFYEDIENLEGVSFKGFIDLVIQVPIRDRKGNIKEGEFGYWILDWKTTDWGWNLEKKTSFAKQMQLLLYKHFYAIKYNIPLKNIKCGWILVKRKIGRASCRERV